jgi:hypothetical protein
MSYFLLPLLLDFMKESFEEHGILGWDIFWILKLRMYNSPICQKSVSRSKKGLPLDNKTLQNF